MNTFEHIVGTGLTDKMIKVNRTLLDAKFKKQFEHQKVQFRHLRAQNDLSLGLLRGLAKKDPKFQRSAKDAKTRAAQANRQLQLQKRTKIDERVSLGSISATYSPPFTPYTWASASGDAVAQTLSANPANGLMKLYARTCLNGGGSGSISLVAAMGVAFQAKYQNAIMDVSSVPAFGYDFQIFASLDSASAGGFFGFLITQFTLGGEYIQTLVDQQINMSGTGGSTGFPLSASTPIDNDHIYAIWVWCGANASGPGWSTFWGAAGASQVSVYVPSISVHAYG